MIKRLIALTTLISVLSVGNTVNAEYREYKGYYKLTGYCPCYSCSEGWGRKTASGAVATEGITAAASKEFPLGTRLYIEGVGYRIVQDRGGAIKGKRIDVFCNDHSSCFAENINKKVKVWVVK